ncbi:MAG: hypothetical protein MK202_01220 [Tenacibaculum sp.]|nr:hypothetical protein [Tenacibaculum sp.]
MNLTSVLLVIILITIAWSYYNLANKYNRSRVGYMLLGLGSYIVVVFLNALSYVFLEIISNNIGRSTHRLLSFLIGVLVVILIHFWLEKKWLKKVNVDANKAIDEIGKE